MMNPAADIMNQSADYWFKKIGVNVIQANTKLKETYENWTKYQDQPIPDQLHEERKQNGYYSNGLAIIPGKIWRGPYAGKYLVAIDLDNKKAIDEFCRDGLDDLKQQTLVEQSSNPDKMHVYFVIEREIPNKSSDKVDISKSEKINANEIPALEVKSKSKGIMFCADSPHENGSNYRIIGTLTPKIFDAQVVEDRIGGICDKYGIPYGSNNNSVNGYQIPIADLWKTDTKIFKGHNRHLELLRIMESELQRNRGIKPLEDIKEICQFWNQKHCDPPLDAREFEKLWKQALEWANKKIKEREEAKQKQQLQQQSQQAKEQSNNTNKTSITTTRTDKQDLIEEATRLVMSKHRFLTIEETKDILYYDEDKGVYVIGGEILIEKELDKTFDFKLKTADITEIRNYVMRKTYTKKEEFDADINVINLKNGLYNWRTNEFFPHSPDYYSLNQKPIVYNPNARPKLFINFLKQVLYQQDIRTAVEIIAYSFIRKNLFERYFILIGTGANGKSVFVGVLSNLHGLKNISNVPLHSLVTNRFALADLENKDANVDTELSSSTINDMSILKKLTGPHPLRIERKGQHAYDAIVWAKHFFNANELPRTSDNSDAHYRREIIITFPIQFQGKKDDPNLLNKLTTEEEMSGIFNLIVNSMRPLLTETKYM